MANIFEPEWVERDQAPLIGRAARVGAQAGAERLGATLYEIDPGGYGSPFHLHHGNEEMIIVLAGRPSLRTLEASANSSPETSSPVPSVDAARINCRTTATNRFAHSSSAR
jgi:hypothetical protein